jgi:hypothetical protein
LGRIAHDEKKLLLGARMTHAYQIIRNVSLVKNEEHFRNEGTHPAIKFMNVVEPNLLPYKTRRND